MNHNEENQPTEIDPTPLTYTDLKRWLGIWVLLISAALLAWALKSILLLFAVVFLVAMVLNPIVAFLERRRIHRGLAVALLALGFVAVFALALSFLIPPLLTQVDERSGKRPKLGTAYKPRYRRLTGAILPFSRRYLKRTRFWTPSVRGPVTGSVFAVLLLAFALISPQPLV